MKTAKEIREMMVSKSTYKDLQIIQNIEQKIINAAENGDNYIYYEPTEVNSVIRTTLINEGYQVQPLNSLGEVCKDGKPVTIYRICW